ncbi:Transmembrane protein 62 [Rhizophlyctis rosea]|nr:Transmembrane protein 62 [Rhizophlyctis rosea]
MDEWIAYHSVLQESGIMERKGGKFYWDQRGNHDCFNLPSFESKKNVFSQLSAVKEEGYAYHLRKPFGTYSFIALDACPRYGVSRPFNFFGYLDTADMDFLATELQKAKSHNHTFVMSHYPTATMMFGKTSDGTTFWELSNHISIWLCGHLHRLFAGLGKTMYAYQGTFLELELADLKVHAVYRVVAVDHDVISFIDLPLEAPTLPMLVEQDIAANPDVGISKQPRLEGRSPIVLITNPKDGRYAVPSHEPANSVAQSSYIRVLVWSHKSVKSTFEVNVDGRSHELEAEYHGKGRPWRRLGVDGAREEADDEDHIPLWVVKWHPSRYDDGQDHWMTITVFDEEGRNGTSQHVQFRVDGARIEDMQAGPGGAIIGFPFGLLVKDLFIALYTLVTVGFLIVPKLFVARLKETNQYGQWRAEMATSLVVADVASRTSTPAKAVLTRLGLRQRRISDSVPHRPWHVRIPADFNYFVRASFFRFTELANQPTLFYPLFLLCLYMVIGPWFIGQFIPDASDWKKRWGWFMLYGVWFMDGHWEPLLDTWLFACYELVYTIGPLVIYLSYCCTPAEYLYSPRNPRCQYPIHERWYIRLTVLCCLLYQSSHAMLMGVFYGPWTVLLSPGKTWVILWSAWVLYRWRFGPYETRFRRYGREGRMNLESVLKARVEVDSAVGNVDNSDGEGVGDDRVNGEVLKGPVGSEGLAFAELVEGPTTSATVSSAHNLRSRQR